MKPSPRRVPPIAGLAEEWRRFNASLDEQLASTASANLAQQTELAALIRTKSEIETRLPSLEKAALESDASALTFTTAKFRLDAVNRKFEVLQQEAARTVLMRGASGIIRRIINHYLVSLPQVLNEYFEPIANDSASRSFLVKTSECVRILGAVRDSWIYEEKPATKVNRKTFDGIVRRAITGACHLGADLQPDPVSEKSEPNTQ